VEENMLKSFAAVYLAILCSLPILMLVQPAGLF